MKVNAATHLLRESIAFVEIGIPAVYSNTTLSDIGSYIDYRKE